MFLGISTWVKSSLDSVTCKVISVSSFPATCSPGPVFQWSQRPFTLYPERALESFLKQQQVSHYQAIRTGLVLTLIFIPALCPFLAACLVQGVERHTEGMFVSLQGFRRRERKLLTHLLLSCSVEVLPSDKAAAAWHLGAHFSFPLSCKWWEAHQGEQLPGPAPSPGSIMKWRFIPASLGLWLSIWDSTWASSDTLHLPGWKEARPPNPPPANGARAIRLAVQVSALGDKSFLTRASQAPGPAGEMEPTDAEWPGVWNCISGTWPNQELVREPPALVLPPDLVKVKARALQALPF